MRRFLSILLLAMMLIGTFTLSPMETMADSARQQAVSQHRLKSASSAVRKAEEKSLSQKNNHIKNAYRYNGIGAPSPRKTTTTTQSGNSGNKQKIDSKKIFQNAYDTLHGTFEDARVIVYALAAFGLIGVAAGGLAGKFDLKWLAMLGVALATLAIAEQIVNYSINAQEIDDPDYSGIGSNDFKLNLQFKDDFKLKTD